jgi:adenylate cyclase
MAKILVVDDETDLEVLIKQKFRRQIREHLYEFVFAINGRDALDKLVQYPDVDIVLSDINMPEMDGLTLLVRLNEISPIIKAVIVSAYGDMDNIRSAMNKGAYDFICKPINFDDLDTTIAKTVRHVLQLRQTLQAIKENNILRMYVDETVLNFMNRREFEATLMVNESIEASVAFIDMCSFTSIAENGPPDIVVRMLNSYFDAMVKEIIAQGGYIDKFMGDAVLAVFRGDYHLDRTIDACIAIRSRIAQFSAETGDIDYLPKVTIGIHTGEMICGNIGSATLRRLDYTVIGDVVNTAKRLHETAEAGQILITESSYELIKESFSCIRIKTVHLKNKSIPVTVYEVVS